MSRRSYARTSRTSSITSEQHVSRPRSGAAASSLSCQNPFARAGCARASYSSAILVDQTAEYLSSADRGSQVDHLTRIVDGRPLFPILVWTVAVVMSWVWLFSDDPPGTLRMQSLLIPPGMELPVGIEVA